MSKVRFAVQTSAALVLLFLTNSLASAQATRTWVSGVGDDANPCSRTAPCKTFAGAISKTAAGGEINVLDPGGFGGVTITKAITIDGSNGSQAGVLVSGTNAIIVNAGVNDKVTIRNLDINGLGSGLNAVRFLAGSSLHVEKCVMYGFQKGIDFEPSGASKLFVSDTIIKNCTSTDVAVVAGGVFIKPGVAGSALCFLDRVNMDRNKFGLRIENRTTATVSNSTISGNDDAGVVLLGDTAPISTLNLETCVVAGNNNIALRSAAAQARMRISNVTVVNNGTGLSPFAGGQIISFGNNSIGGNTTENPVSSTTAQQ